MASIALSHSLAGLQCPRAPFATAGIHTPLVNSTTRASHTHTYMSVRLAKSDSSDNRIAGPPTHLSKHVNLPPIYPGITGLPVVENSRAVMISSYNALRARAEQLPVSTILTWHEANVCLFLTLFPGRLSFAEGGLQPGCDQHVQRAPQSVRGERRCQCSSHPAPSSNHVLASLSCDLTTSSPPPDRCR